MMIGSAIGATLGMLGSTNEMWMKKNVLKPGKRAIKKASRVMNDVASML